MPHMKDDTDKKTKYDTKPRCRWSTMNMKTTLRPNWIACSLTFVALRSWVAFPSGLQKGGLSAEGGPIPGEETRSKEHLVVTVSAMFL